MEAIHCGYPECRRVAVLVKSLAKEMVESSKRYAIFCLHRAYGPLHSLPLESRCEYPHHRPNPCPRISLSLCCLAYREHLNTPLHWPWEHHLFCEVNKLLTGKPQEALYKHLTILTWSFNCLDRWTRNDFADNMTKLRPSIQCYLVFNTARWYNSVSICFRYHHNKNNISVGAQFLTTSSVCCLSQKLLRKAAQLHWHDDMSKIMYILASH